MSFTKTAATLQQCISFSEPEISGLQVLERSGLDLNYDAQNSMGAAICRIDGEGCGFPQEDCFCQCQEPPCFFWSYWYRTDGEWTFSPLGAASRKVKDGYTEAWVWSEGTISNNAERQPPASLTFDNVCAPTPTATTVPTATQTPVPTVQSARRVTATPSQTPTSPPTATGTAVPSATPTALALPVIHRFAADRTQIDFGETAMLFWDVGAADSVTLHTTAGQEPLPAQGEKPVSPDRTTSYSLTARNAGGNIGAEVIIEVAPVFWTPTPANPGDSANVTPAVPETPTPVPTETPLSTPMPTATERPSETPTAIPTETPLPTDTPVPTDTETPIPSATPIADTVNTGSVGQAIVIATPPSNNDDQLQRVMVIGGLAFVVGVPLLFVGIWLLVYSMWKKK